MKKRIILLLIITTSFTYSQNRKWGLSYAAEFTNYKITDIYSSSLEGDFTMHNINLHYNFTSWASPFQIGPLFSYRFAEIKNDYEAERVDDFQVGLNLGINLNNTFAFVIDTYKVLNRNDFDDHNIFVIKPSLELGLSDKIYMVVGYSNYIYSGTWRQNNGIDEMKANALLLGLKYKFY